jgi:hypothetical protein
MSDDDEGLAQEVVPARVVAVPRAQPHRHALQLRQSQRKLAMTALVLSRTHNEDAKPLPGNFR